MRSLVHMAACDQKQGQSHWSTVNATSEMVPTHTINDTSDGPLVVHIGEENQLLVDKICKRYEVNLLSIQIRLKWWERGGREWSRPHPTHRRHTSFRPWPLSSFLCCSQLVSHSFLLSACFLLNAWQISNLIQALTHSTHTPVTTREHYTKWEWVPPPWLATACCNQNATNYYHFRPTRAYSNN